ncbi:hypothetical protein E6O75_ATG06408 [Venturia nashicola]|uniref:Uncharacterized protein n=1 Tax=Venturia nashicola TaxID=86259 RepID=A0A4Z1NUS7_9PEZI|nr:hypothetical protein E6O75_ATG06408 [Venturia nashicola]
MDNFLALDVFLKHNEFEYQEAGFLGQSERTRTIFCKATLKQAPKSPNLTSLHVSFTMMTDSLIEKFEQTLLLFENIKVNSHGYIVLEFFPNLWPRPSMFERPGMRIGASIEVISQDEDLDIQTDKDQSLDII